MTANQQQNDHKTVVTGAAQSASLAKSTQNIEPSLYPNPLPISGNEITELTNTNE